mgnify:FL=1
MTKELMIDTEEFAKEIAWLNKMPSVEPTSAVIQITAVVGAVIVRRVSDGQYRESTVQAVGGDQASVTVAVSKLLDAMKVLTGTLTLTIEDDGLSLESSDRKVTLRSAKNTVEFPAWPQFAGNEFEVLLPDSLTQVLTSVGNDDNIPTLKNIAFDGGTMVSTDRHRLSRVVYDQRGFTGHVPAAVLRAFAKADTAVYVTAGVVDGQPWVQLRSNNRYCTSPMPDVSFPNWKKLIPESELVKVVFDRNQMLKAISGDEVSLTVDGDSIIIVSESDDMRTEQKVALNRTISNKSDGPVTVTISSKYVRDSLRGLGTSQAMLGINAPDSPVVFSDFINTLHLVMPIRKAS